MIERRNSVIEVTRIICIYLIIVGHALNHGRVVENFSEYSAVGFALRALMLLSIPATNLFVLIGSYYMYYSQFKIRRFFILWFQLFFINGFAYLIGVALGIVHITASSLLVILFPVSMNRSWYMRVYFGLMLMSPFLNILLQNLSEKQHQLLIAVCIMLFSLWRNFLPFAVTLNLEGGNGLVWFITLYIIAAYIRKFLNVQGKTFKLTILFLIVYIITVCLKYMTIYLSNTLKLNGKGTSVFSEFTSITILSLSVICFLVALSVQNNIPDKIQKSINWMAASTLSVYLIHDNPVIAKMLWSNEVIELMICSPRRAVLTVLGVALIVFGMCVTIDKIIINPLIRSLKKYSFTRLQMRLDHWMEDIKT